jgi:hypothetical protein
VLAWLGGSPSTQDWTRRYIDTAIRFMRQSTTRQAALHVARSIPSAVASMGQDDESFRECFSEALALAVLSYAPQTYNDTPFTSLFLFRDIPYLRLLCALSQKPTWHPQLHQNCHFNNCLAIAETLSSREDDLLDECVVPLAQIFAIMDASGDERPPFTEDLAYVVWPLALRAWRYIFNLPFFGGTAYVKFWQLELAITMEYLDVLPSLVYSARKRWDQGKETDRLLALVENACGKLNEDKPHHKQDGSQY